MINYLYTRSTLEDMLHVISHMLKSGLGVYLGKITIQLGRVYVLTTRNRARTKN